MSQEYLYSSTGKTYRDSYWSVRNVALSPIIIPCGFVVYALTVAAFLLTKISDAASNYSPKFSAKHVEVLVRKDKP